MKPNKHLTFSKKIILIELLSLLIPLTLTLSLCYSAYSHMVIEDMKAVSIQQINFLSQYLDNTFMSVNRNLSTWMSSEHIHDYLEKDSFDETDLEHIQDSLTDLCTFQSYYQNAYLYHADQNQLYSAFSESIHADCQDPDFLKWLSSVQKVYTFQIGLYTLGQGSSIFCVIPVCSYGSHHFLGYCMIKLPMTLLIDAFSICNYPYGTLCCISGDGTVLRSTDYSGELPVDYKQISGSGSFQTIDHQLVYRNIVAQSDFSVISICPNTIYSIRGTVPFYIVVAISIICILLSLGISIILLRRLLLPIRSMAKTMAETDPNDLQPIPVTNTHDEVGILEETYNDMILRINDMVEAQYRADIAVKDARLRALQLQINPHFVNNTLQMIGTLAAERDMMDIYDLLSAFSRMFYYCLKYKGDVVSFSDELNYLDDYITIQEGRFPGKFQFQVAIDERTKKLEIPKMSIQPLIENSFTHSFGNMHHSWIIKIRSYYYDSYYTIIIEDNGCGMSTGALHELRRRLQEINTDNPFHTHSSIGLKNVNTRIKLLYGMDYGMEIESELSKGTKITLTLPTKKGEYKNDPHIDRG